ncbi:hypothetical protein KVV02_000716, partial [Mortierella alpina]
ISDMADLVQQKEGKADIVDMGDALALKEQAPSIDSLDDLVDDSPIPEVRASVPPTDDPTLPTRTFRAWSLGIFFTIVLAFVNQFFWFRDNPLTIRVLVAQLLAYPLGRILARVLPTRTFSIFGYKFSLNPGPFNIKEHVLITIMANTGATTFAAIDIIVVQKIFYNDSWGFGGGLLLVISTQFVGYGFAGALRRFLVRPATMVWPVNLVNATLGVVGPLKFLSPSSMYYPIVWFFFIGFVIPIPFYLLSLKFPNSWVKDVNMAAFMLGGGPYPPAGASIMPTWAFLGFVFNFVIKRRHFGWWSKYNYVMSAALDAGVAISALVIFFALQNNNIHMPQWWGNNSSSIDQCPRVTQNWAGHDTYAEKAAAAQ